MKTQGETLSEEQKEDCSQCNKTTFNIYSKLGTDNTLDSYEVRCAECNAIAIKVMIG